MKPADLQPKRIRGWSYEIRGGPAERLAEWHIASIPPPKKKKRNIQSKKGHMLKKRNVQSRKGHRSKLLFMSPFVTFSWLGMTENILITSSKIQIKCLVTWKDFLPVSGDLYEGSFLINQLLFISRPLTFLLSTSLQCKQRHASSQASRFICLE